MYDCIRLRRQTWQAATGRCGLRVFALALFWASLAHLSWLAFRLSQERLQPDAIAMGVPGFLFRLVIRPAEWAMQSFHGVAPAPLVLQVAILMAICFVIVARPRARLLGEERVEIVDLR
ncbi:hypothetical protein [Tropicimonas sp. IMCC6043]|uniref:hypothetical protein n=1 Tax=Tropicimonas sp. IMCC6043 TaxID=2510645 RepID=UPI00101B941E|nr:hypothetical protein [Tropicimonas sp. IMCC6043]RYH10421.1 hypothetical protein EU800_09060 [Tropicimonas sp. IMCC6043]